MSHGTGAKLLVNIDEIISKYFAVKIPDVYVKSVGYHTDCSKDFIAIPTLPVDVRVCEHPQSR